MKKQKYYINLTNQERSEILSSLLIKKNKLTQQGRYADGVDDAMLATEEVVQNPDICWDEIRSSLDSMIDFSNPQIDRNIIKKFVAKIVPNGRNHFRWYMNLDGRETTTLDMVTEGRKITLLSASMMTRRKILLYITGM